MKNYQTPTLDRIDLGTADLLTLSNTKYASGYEGDVWDLSGKDIWY